MLHLPIAIAAAVITSGDRVADANRFALELHQACVAREEGAGNAFLSPFSVRSAFAMCLHAATGDTREQIASTVRLDDDAKPFHVGDAVRVANRLWGDAGRPAGYYRKPFIDLMADRFGGAFGTVPFAQPESARRTINAWVAGETGQAIPELIGDEVLDRLTRLVITNAVHFQADWKNRFDAARTTPEPFRGPDGDVTVDMMRADAAFRWVRHDGVLALELPYADDELTMLVAMPEQGDLAEFERRLTLERFDDLRGRLAKARHSVVRLPKLELSTSYALHEAVLPSMGMSAPFQFSYDWAPLNGGVEDLKISHVLHDAFVRVDEKGTEASAATAVVIKARGMPPTVRIDRPFFFVIRHVETGLILFTGRVTDPTGD